MDRAQRLVLNLGGESEARGAVNLQGKWTLDESWRSSRHGETLSELQDRGPFVVAHNDQLPFADNTFEKVVTNNVPINRNTFLGPGIQTTEIKRVLTDDGVWIHNGILIRATELKRHKG